MFSSVEQILAHKFVGNFHDDGGSFDAIDDFLLRDDVSRVDKLAIVNHQLVNGMGCDPITIDQLDEAISPE